jgi:hypothetical protein
MLMSGFMAPLLGYREMTNFTAELDACNGGQGKTLKRILSLHFLYLLVQFPFMNLILSYNQGNCVR